MKEPISVDKLDELSWRMQVQVPGWFDFEELQRGQRVVFAMVCEVAADGSHVMQVTAADATGAPRLVCELSDSGDVELWKACEFCAKRAGYYSTERGQFACDTCAHNRQEYEPIEVA